MRDRRFFLSTIIGCFPRGASVGGPRIGRGVLRKGCAQPAPSWIFAPRSIKFVYVAPDAGRGKGAILASRGVYLQ